MIPVTTLIQSIIIGDQIFELYTVQESVSKIFNTLYTVQYPTHSQTITLKLHTHDSTISTQKHTDRQTPSETAPT